MLLIPDLPGAGKSTLDGATGMTGMAASVQEMLNHEGLETAVIAGHSMGGYVALAFAATWPEAVAGLALVHSTPVADDEEKKQVRRKAIDIILNGGKTAFIRQMVPNLFAAGFKQSHLSTVEQITEGCMKMNEESLANFYDAMIRRDDSSSRLINSDFPVQWVLGAEDALMPVTKNMANCYLSNLNFVEVMDGVGHMSMIESPQKLAACLSSFAGYCYDSSRRKK